MSRYGLLICLFCVFATDESLAFIGRMRDTTGDGLIDVDDAGALFIAQIDGEAPAPLTDLDMDVRTLAWSPGRERLAFHAHYTDTTGNRVVNRSDNASIFVIEPARGEAARALTGSDTHDGFPSWSPDGRQIAFAASDGANAAIEIIAADCAGPESGCAEARQTLTEGTGLYLDVAWSPDGRYIAFLALRDTHADGALNRLEDHAALYMVEVETGARFELAPDDSPKGAPAWSSDGEHLAYYALTDTDGDGYIDPFYDYAGLFIVDISAPDPAPYRITGANVHATDPAWAPSGTLRLAYSALTDTNGDGRLDAATDSASIFIVALAGGAAQPLTGTDTLDYLPTWSPDGSLVAYVSVPAAGEGGVGTAVNRRGGVFVVEADCASACTPRRISPEGMDAFAPVWH